MKIIKAILIAHRIEFTPVTIALCLSFMIINISDISELFRPIPILAFLVVNIATYWGSIYNVYHDYELDKRNECKSRLSDSVDIVGWRGVRLFIITEPLIFLSLGLYIAYETQNYLSLLLLMIGTFFAAAYSKEPLRFKRRGILNSISLFMVIMFFPPLYGYLIMNNNTITGIDLLLIFGLALVEYGLGLYYTTVDYSEDKLDNIKTPSVLLGVQSSVSISVLLIGAGIFCLAYGYYIKSAYLSLIISSIGSLVPMVWILLFLVNTPNDDQLEIVMKKNEALIPLWVAISAFAVLVANCIHLVN